MKNYVWLCCLSLFSVFMFSSMANAACYDDETYFGAVSQSYKPKGSFSKKASDGDIQLAKDMAVQVAWDEYIATCFDAGRMQEYLSKKNNILGSINNYITVRNLSHKVNKKDKKIEAEALISVKKNLIEGLFTQASGAASGDGALMVWVFAARQASFVKDGTSKKFDPNITKKAESKSLDTSESVVADDGTTIAQSNLTESKSQTKSSGVTVAGGNEQTSIEREYVVISSADIDTKISSVLSLNNFEPIAYEDLVNECGGEEPKYVQDELAANGKMERITRKAVFAAARECEIELFAIGTIDVSIPKKSNVEGYNVTVSINGEVLDVRKRLPKKVAAIGPVQAQAGGADDQVAIRNALSLAGEATAKEIVSRLNAKGIK